MSTGGSPHCRSHRKNCVDLTVPSMYLLLALRRSLEMEGLWVVGSDSAKFINSCSYILMMSPVERKVEKLS